MLEVVPWSHQRDGRELRQLPSMDPGSRGQAFDFCLDQRAAEEGKSRQVELALA